MMLFRDLASHSRKNTWRTPGLYGDLFQKIMMWLGAIYFGGCALLIGIVLPEMLEDAPYDVDYWQMVSSGFGYYVLAGVLLRMLITNLDQINPQPYYFLPIKRAALVRFIVLRSLLNPINYFLQILLLLPYLIRELVGGYISLWIFVSMLLTGVFLAWFNMLLSTFLKRYTVGKPVAVLLIVSVIVGLFVLDYFDIVPLYDFFLATIPATVGSGLSLLISLGMAFCAYWLNIRYFSKKYYDESFVVKKKERGERLQFSFLDSWGEIGNYMSFMLKMIFRHRRTRSTVFIAVVFLLYGLLMYSDSVTKGGSRGMMFFSALFITGAPMLMFQQFFFGWNAQHFDLLMTSKFDTRTYLKVHYIFMIIGCFVWFILSTPYFLKGTDFVILHTSAFLYNIGFNTIFILLFASFNTKRISLDSKSAMSYQGSSYKNFLIMIPMIFLPWVFVGIMAMFAPWQTAVYALGGFGVLCLLLHRPIFNMVEKTFLARKYTLCEGFREQA